MGEKLQLLIAMAGYMLIVILIGIFFAKKSQANSADARSAPGSPQ